LPFFIWYPNGRRPGDDVVDISIRAAMGLLCVLTGPADSLQLDCHPPDAPSDAMPFTDGVRKTAANTKPKVVPIFFGVHLISL